MGMTLIAPHGDEACTMILRMAADLIEGDALCDHRTSFRALVLRGHNSFYVSALIDDARHVAMQSVVAAEISKP